MNAQIEAPARAAATTRAARLITEAFAPAVLVAAQLLLVAWHSTHALLAALGWAALAASFASFLPIAYMVWGARRGRWDTHHVRQRELRRVPLLVAIGSVTVGLAILAYLDAPRDLLALVGAMLAGLLLTITVTHWWKVSIHSAVAGGTAAILVILFGAPGGLSAPILGLIAWSRVRLGDHTPPQVVAGGFLGGTVAGGVFALLR